MKRCKFYIFTALAVVCLISFSSCEDISGTFNSFIGRNHKESINTPNNDDSTNEIDSGSEELKDSTAKTIANKLVKEVEAKIANQSDSINVLNGRINQLENKADSMIDKTSAYTFMLFEFLVLAFVIGFLFRKLNRRTKKIKHTLLKLDMPNSENSLSEFQVNQMINKGLKDLAEQATNYNKKQDLRIDEIEKIIKKLMPSSFSDNPNYKESTYNTQSNNDIKRCDEPTVFYMPRTMIKGQFDDSKKLSKKGDNAYFKFTVKKKGKAEFIFDPYEEGYISRAYDDKEKSLLTVCDVETKSATPTSVENITPGEAELRDNVWIVTKKLKLRYV